MWVREYCLLLRTQGCFPSVLLSSRLELGPLVLVGLGISCVAYLSMHYIFVEHVVFV